MAKMSRVLTLFVLFLDYWISAEGYPHFRIQDDSRHQASPEDPTVAAFEKASMAASPTAREDPDERANVSWNSLEPDSSLDSVDKLPDDDKKRNRYFSLIHKAVTAAPLPEAASLDLRCEQLLYFLQKNIILVAFTVVGIFGAIVLLVFALTSCMKRSQPLHPPANTSYTIFILDEKSWGRKA